MTTDDFSLDGYARIVERVLNRGYRVEDFLSADPAQRHLVLRHDVDFDIEAALAMARMETSHGWHATYFILLRSEFYNPNAPRSVAALRAFSGHEVGLHFDASIHAGNEKALAVELRREASMLSDIIGREVRTFSLHRPSPVLLDGQFEVEGFTNAYNPRFFRDMGYCSDSQGLWRFGPPDEHAALREGRGLQLLTHPIWWTASAAATDPSARVDEFLERRAMLLDHEAARNCKTYRSKR